MFADIGSGARASGMVSQGKVSALIGAKPEERRAVLEEAAGTAGLRARRHEAELKLRQAETNLTRADDLRIQLESQRESLRKQARGAARYRNLSGLIRAAEGEWMAILAARAEASLLTSRAALDHARAATRDAEREAEAATRAAFAADAALNADPGVRWAEAAARPRSNAAGSRGEGLAAAESRARAALSAAETRLAQILADLDAADRTLRDAAEAEARLAGEASGLAAALADLARTGRDRAGNRAAEAAEGRRGSARPRPSGAA
jgi:chromosome segregation protein